MYILDSKKEKSILITKSTQPKQEKIEDVEFYYKRIENWLQ